MFCQPPQPILKKKQLSLNESQLNSLKCIEFDVQLHLNIPLCGIYTCIDQAMAIWGIISAIIFTTAQFTAISWTDQAIIWSIVTLIGIWIMVVLNYSWTFREGISWLLYLWAGLMLVGIIITDLVIAYSWGVMLENLCDLWLILNVIGYGLTGLGMRSRAFLLSAIVHGLTIVILPLFIEWQFLVTGIVMASNLLIFAERQWDMLPPSKLRLAEKVNL